MDDLNFTTQQSFLHHGVEGQKWGVQNGPPYPLSSYLSTGKSLRKAARKEAKYGSKEYKEAKALVKRKKAEKLLAKDNFYEFVRPGTFKLLNEDYKIAKIEYKRAKAELNKAKMNTEEAKDVLKKVDKMSLDEVEQFLKDRGYTTKSISKLAMKDYKKETKQAEKNGRPHITENEKKS